ncbi:MAG: hypothetical protein HOC66_03690 [Flavobacteriales bacterium]|nr:hypothetical protein [Flavobacteriales bacterium]
MGKIYSVIEAGDDKGDINYLIKIDYSHPVFKGHFPKKAVLPGVMMCDIIRYLISDKLGFQVQLSFAKNIKFSKMIIPSKNNTYNVMVSIIENEKKYNIKAIISQSDDIYFKINAQYQIK